MRVTEGTLEQEVAPRLAQALGAQVVTQTTTGNRRPDVILELPGSRYVVELEVGGERKLLEAISQAYEYQLRVNADGIIALVYPESSRRTVENQDDVVDIVLNTSVDALVLSPLLTQRFSGIRLEAFGGRLRDAFRTKETRVDVNLVTRVMREAVQTLSLKLKRSHAVARPALDVVISRFELFQALGAGQVAGQGELGRDLTAVACDLTAYVLVNQLLLYHLLQQSLRLRPLPVSLERVSDLRSYFRDVVTVDYKAVYGVDPLPHLPDTARPEVQKIILAIRAIRPEHIPHDLIGRIFHEFLPDETRKQLATFYTKPVAAELLATLAVEDGREVLIDPACGSGTLLVSAYRRKRTLTGAGHNATLTQVIGNDIMPFATHLAALNLTLQALDEPTDAVLVGLGNALEYGPGSGVATQLALFPSSKARVTAQSAIEGFSLPEHTDLVIMNPPFTDRRRIKDSMLGNRADAFEPAQNYWAYFIHLADGLIGEMGRVAAVLPRLFLAGSQSEAVRRQLFKDKGYSLRYLVRTCKEIAFSEAAAFRDFLVILDKGRPSQWCGVVYLKRSLSEITLEEAREIATRVKGVNEGRRHEDDDISLTWVAQAKVKRNWRNLWFLVGYERHDNGQVIQGLLDDASAKVSDHLVPLGTQTALTVRRGFEPKPSGLYDPVFLVRPIDPARTSRAALILTREGPGGYQAQSRVSSRAITIPTEATIPGLKTASYVGQWQIDDVHDRVIVRRFKGFRERVELPLDIKVDFEYLQRAVDRRLCHLLVAKRIDLAAPGTSAIAYYSEAQTVSANVMYSVICTPDYARALCLWFNSVFGISQFLTERMETRGSFCDLLLETLNLLVVPSMAFATRHLADLDSLMTRYGNEQLPSLIEQFTTPPAARLALDSTMMTIMGWTRREAESMLPQVYKALASELTLVASAMSGQIADEEPDSAHTQLGLDESDAD